MEKREIKRVLKSKDIDELVALVLKEREQTEDVIVIRVMATENGNEVWIDHTGVTWGSLTLHIQLAQHIALDDYLNRKEEEEVD